MFGLGAYRRMVIRGRDVPLDLCERIIVLALFLNFSVRMLPRLADLLDRGLLAADHSAATGALLLVVSESLAVGLVLMRPTRGTVSARPLDWVLGFAGAAAPLLVHPASAGSLPDWAGQSIMLAGLLLQISAKLALWTSFGVVAATRSVRSNGPYRFIRHPMYLGYSLTHVGFLIGYPSGYNAVLYTSVLLVDVSRLLREEQLLTADPAYIAYSERVRYRMLPGLF